MIVRMLKSVVLGSSLILAGFAVCSVVALPAVHAKGGVKELKVEGRLLGVNVASGTVSIAVGSSTVAVTATPTTKVERNGRRTTLANLKVGDRIQATLAPGGGSIATKIEAVGL